MDPTEIYIFDEFRQNSADVAAFGWIDLQTVMMFFIHFFCASKYMLAVYGI